MVRAGRTALPVVALAAALGFVGELAFAAPEGMGATSAARTVRAPAAAEQAAATMERAAAAEGAAAGESAGRLSRQVSGLRAAARGRLSRTRRNRLVGKRMLARRRWSSPREFHCLDRLWARESHWNHRASQPTTGAYGIPQAHPGAKMAAAGGDWRSNPRTQIKWGLRYVRGRHGGACAAWSHFRGRGWY